MPDVAAVIVAAGRGTRAAGGDLPKQFRRIGGETMLRRTLSMFVEHANVGRVQPVIHPEDQARYRDAVAGIDTLAPVFGGATRQASVRAGLEALSAQAPDIVLIHDAARPFATPDLVSRAIAATAATGAAIPALTVTDTVKTVDIDNNVQQTLDRASLRLVQTPQGFDFAALLDAHRRAARAGRDDFTDDAALAEWAGMKVAVFAGEPGNIKITNAGDFARAEAMQFAAHFSGLGDVRIGNGIDVHAFGQNTEFGDHVILGGIRIPHTQALTGHSDADVALHALTDAILGALAEGDIGAHFPPSDPQWRHASSDRFLAFAVERVTARGGRIAHLDLTMVCEAPRIGPHRDAMRASIAALAGIAIERVAVKATTSEKLGFTGRGEGIAAYATATVRLPWSAPSRTISKSMSSIPIGDGNRFSEKIMRKKKCRMEF
jgi:2-C-methyl-D-erythritol 4-phosphate cytidylyltransferase/2-C-methyl-D-erythritol 2,4-cyclodiphosphate synthase